MAIKKRGGLGSGMSSLFSSNEIEEKHSGGVLEVDINKITPNPNSQGINLMMLHLWNWLILLRK